jgi:N-acetylmuramoyl-L-alanine amidase
VVNNFSQSIPFVASPNFGSRDDCEIYGCVIHYTAGGSALGTVRWLADPMSRASAHFVVSRDGSVTQLVCTEVKAWHAGISEMEYQGEMTSDASRFTIGIELANHGYLHRDGDRFLYEIGRELKTYRREQPIEMALRYYDGRLLAGWWEPYPDAQIDALQTLLLQLSAQYGEAAGNVIGHEEIAMPLGRKRDPGPLFPWERFSRRAPRRTNAVAI